jgi:hypothetical protein
MSLLLPEIIRLSLSTFPSLSMWIMPCLPWTDESLTVADSRRPFDSPGTSRHILPVFLPSRGQYLSLPGFISQRSLEPPTTLHPSCCRSLQPGKSHLADVPPSSTRFALRLRVIENHAYLMSCSRVANAKLATLSAYHRDACSSCLAVGHPSAQNPIRSLDSGSRIIASDAIRRHGGKESGR